MRILPASVCKASNEGLESRCDHNGGSDKNSDAAFSETTFTQVEKHGPSGRQKFDSLPKEACRGFGVVFNQQ